MASIDDKITALETKLKQAKAQKQQQEARKRAALLKASRKDDTRRKILVGAAIIAACPPEKLTELLEGALTRADDRALFGLSPLPPQSAKSPAS